MTQLLPLAERLRPKLLKDYIGQEHLVGTNGVLSKSILAGNLPSLLLWGPPGVGKTTLANIIANELNRTFYSLSAINSGVKDVREVLEKAASNNLFINKPILFIDEIHRFSKSQQDSLLGAVEKGIITLIGATTENPSFEVISALLSRCQVYILRPLTETDLKKMLNVAMMEDEYLSTRKIELKETEALIRLSDGDGRKLLNIFELLVNSSQSKDVIITDELVQEQVQQNIALYDKTGEQHYDIISAFIKSIRGSDPNAAVYWLARMLVGGEDVLFIARRMLILASEDIGLANPTALVMANNCFQAVNVIGMPEARIILSQTVIYLATSAKSNASYLAIDEAMKLVNQTGNEAVPLHLRNAATKFMKNIGYGKNYDYSHQNVGNFAPQEYLPESFAGKKLFDPGDNPRENEIRKQLKSWWNEKYNY